jgi:alcohol dehydrogenase class IV
MHSTMFTMPTLVKFGCGIRHSLTPLLRENGVQRVFLVYDKGVQAAGLIDEAASSMREAGITLCHFNEVLPNAPDYQVELAAEKARSFQAEAIVSIGGGSSIDTAKAVNILLSNPGPISRYDGINLVKNPGRLHVAIPTTAGTSSEMTVVAVISDEKNTKKMVIFGSNVAASIALIDPELTYKLPPKITAATGMDALTHAIEAYISTASSPITDAIAPEAIALIASNLPLAYKNGLDFEARNKVMQGCQMAGVCFSNAGLGLVHSLAQPMGAHCHVPHGLANAICLAAVLRFTMPAVPAHKIVRLASALGLQVEEQDPATLGHRICDFLEQLARRLEIPSIIEAGVREDRIPAMAADALKELSTPTTPRMATLPEVIMLYEKLFDQAGSSANTAAAACKKEAA